MTPLGALCLLTNYWFVSHFPIFCGIHFHACPPEKLLLMVTSPAAFAGNATSNQSTSAFLVAPSQFFVCLGPWPAAPWPQGAWTSFAQPNSARTPKGVPPQRPTACSLTLVSPISLFLPDALPVLIPFLNFTPPIRTIAG